MERQIIQQLVLKKKFNQISRELKVCKKTVKKIFIKAKNAGYLDGKELPAFPDNHFDLETTADSSNKISDPDMILLPHKNWIKDRRNAEWHWVTIWEELPIIVSRASFFRFIKRHELNTGNSNSRVVPEIVHAPGEALILDWGKLCDFTDSNGKKKTAWAFVGVLGFSRWMSVRIVYSNSTEETLVALESILREIGGVTRRVTSDNPKCFAIEASKYEPLLNIAFERFASHYGFIIECLPPADPEKKGKVERLMPFVRRLFEAYGEWKGLSDAQAYLNKKVDLANNRKHGTTRMYPFKQLHDVELDTLKPLPALSFEREEYHETEVRQDGHVRFRSKYYSLEEKYIGKKVFIIGTYARVCIYHQNKLIETHGRLHYGNTSKATKKHHLKPAEQIMDDNELYFKRASKIGLHTTEVVRKILLMGHGFVDNRKIWGILGLDKGNTHQEIEAACEYALNQNDLSYRTIHGYLESRKKEITSIECKSQAHRFIRNVDEYQRLLSWAISEKEKKLCH